MEIFLGDMPAFRQTLLIVVDANLLLSNIVDKVMYSERTGRYLHPRQRTIQEDFEAGNLWNIFCGTLTEEDLSPEKFLDICAEPLLTLLHVMHNHYGGIVPRYLQVSDNYGALILIVHTTLMRYIEWFKRNRPANWEDYKFHLRAYNELLDLH